jgi:predicted transcriptional regulator
MLYSRVMSKTVSIRVSEEVHARLQERAGREGTTVTALLTEAALRDPRLSDPASLVRAARWVSDHADEFAAAFPEEEPSPRAAGTRDAA